MSQNGRGKAYPIMVSDSRCEIVSVEGSVYALLVRNRGMVVMVGKVVEGSAAVPFGPYGVGAPTVGGGSRWPTISSTP
jgi:hypothetical protein